MTHPGFTSMEVLAILNDTPMPEGSRWSRYDDPCGYPEPPESPSERSEREQDERAYAEYGPMECEF